MLNLKSNITLSAVLGILVLLLLYTYIGDGGRKERSFKKDLFTIDTSKVSEILIYPKSLNGKEVKIQKKNNEWAMQLENNSIAKVPNIKINNLINLLLKAKPKRLAAKSKDKWNEYKVDEKATRVKLMEGNDEVLNLVLGKFSFQQPRQMNSFVRLFDDVNVYEVEGMLEMAFNQNQNYFRDNKILNENKNNWNSLTFNYPNSSFTLKNNEGVWNIDGVKTDSAKTDKFLQTLSRLNSREFVDGRSYQAPINTLKILRKDSTFATINSYISDTLAVINSSENAQSYFDGSKNKLLSKIFINKKDLLN